MRVRDVTITAPLERGLVVELEGAEGAGPAACAHHYSADDGEFKRCYYWQAAKPLVALLMRDAIAKLRLAYKHAYAAPSGFEGSGIIGRPRRSDGAGRADEAGATLGFAVACECRRGLRVAAGDGAGTYARERWDGGGGG
ncbi:hypothetical protein H2201_008742 [Coniosporium apollinis]|uniref:Uncharacterized protein n=1 Tax=Coniosporium apollinis TaxID=61459 RepID=A0ABQ9NJL7_9PEZI|nr:hypothetical protein H2201_008742 [Coniosporium apollinis]